MVGSIRLDRRRFVAAATALAASPLLQATPLGDADASAALFLCDRHCAALLRRAERRDAIVWFNGDVTALWTTTLRPLWRSGAARVAGVTRTPALFCLEQLARGMRHHVVTREILEAPDTVRWVIAPVRTGGFV